MKATTSTTNEPPSSTHSTPSTPKKKWWWQQRRRRHLGVGMLAALASVVGLNLLHGIHMTKGVQTQLQQLVGYGDTMKANEGSVITDTTSSGTTLTRSNIVNNTTAQNHNNNENPTARRQLPSQTNLSSSSRNEQIDDSTTNGNSTTSNTTTHNRPNSEKDTTSTSSQPPSSPQPATPPLNIVLFYADDWTLKVMGTLNPYVSTPHIDNMAKNGILFRNSFVTTSVCWMSRATLLTGTYTSRHKHTKAFGKKLFETHDWKQTLFPKLKLSSKKYYTGIIGKWHAPTPPKYMNLAFDEYSKLYYKQHWLERDGVLRHVTDLNQQDALEFLKNRPRTNNAQTQNQPFALIVSFFATHSWQNHFPSYNPMNREKWFPNNTTATKNSIIPTPITATDRHWEELPDFLHSELNMGREQWKKRWEPDYYQDTIKDLYGMASEVDEAIGNIVDELKRQGVYENTLLVFTTDNGDLHGEHGLAEKWYPFEESIQVPLVIQDPRMPKDVRGTIKDEFVLNVDLAPTMLGAAGIPPSDFMQGRDIAELYLEPRQPPLRSDIDNNKEQGGNATRTTLTPPWRTDFFYEYNNGDPVTAKGHSRKYGQGGHTVDASFALITKEWKYIYWPEQEYEQLFHRTVDPYDERDILLVNATTTKGNESSLALSLSSSRALSPETMEKKYRELKERFWYLKKWAQDGNKV